jgi:hypothetical protein
MSWKQPIPVTIDGLSKKEQSVMQRILLRCRNETGFATIDGAEIKLERGECIIGRYEFAEEFLLKRKESMRVQRIVDKLVKVNKLMSKRKSLNCTIITIHNYDSLVSIEQTNEQSPSNHRAIDEPSMSTNKSDKSDKSVKSDKREKSIKKELERKWDTADKLRKDPSKVEEIADFFKVDVPYVMGKIDFVEDYAKSEGKIYYDYNATVRNFIRRDIGWGNAPVKVKKPSDLILSNIEDEYFKLQGGGVDLNYANSEHYKNFVKERLKELGYDS